MSFKSGFGDLTAASVQIVQQIESINDATVDMSNTTIENLKSISDVQEHITFEGNAKCQFRDTGIYIQSPSDAALSIISDGTLTFDADTDIILSAAGGNVTMDDGSITIFDFNTADTTLTIHDDQDTGDKVVMTMAQHGAFTIVTTDDDDAAANIGITADGTFTATATTITLDSSGDLALSADGGNVTMDDGTTTVFDFDVNEVVLKMMDDADTGDYFSIAVGASGRTVFTTVDDDAAAANVTFNVDGIMQIGENLGSSAKFNTVQDFTGSDPYGFATDGDMGGEIIKLGSATTTLSNLYFLTDSGAWTATDANAEATAGPVLLALALGTNSGTHGMLLRGFARVASSLLASTGTAKQGDPVYISGTAGALTFTAPSANNDIVRVVGHLIIPANSNTDSIIYFNPDTTWVKVVA